MPAEMIAVRLSFSFVTCHFHSSESARPSLIAYSSWMNFFFKFHVTFVGRRRMIQK